MEPSLWQHQTVDTIADPLGPDLTVQAFASGVMAGIVVVVAILLWRQPRSRMAARRRRAAIVTGWGDLFRLVATVVRGVLWLIAVLLLLGRIVFWPAGRRW